MAVPSPLPCYLEERVLGCLGFHACLQIPVTSRACRSPTGVSGCKTFRAATGPGPEDRHLAAPLFLKSYKGFTYSKAPRAFTQNHNYNSCKIEILHTPLLTNADSCFFLPADALPKCVFHKSPCCRPHSRSTTQPRANRGLTEANSSRFGWLVGGGMHFTSQLTLDKRRPFFGDSWLDLLQYYYHLRQRLMYRPVHCSPL